MNTTQILAVVLTALVVAGGVYYYWNQDTNKTQVAVATPTPTPTATLNSNNGPMDILGNEPSQTPGEITPFTQEVKATLVTNKGNINLVLDGQRAPLTVGNFVKLAQDNFYDGTTFHRVIKDFMIQAGDPYSKDPSKQDVVGLGGPGYRFKDEINKELLVKGSLAMANAGPNTNGSQFFIVTTEATPWLDGKHTNFGKVADEASMAGVESIEAVATGAGDKPVQPVVIQDVQVEL